MTIKLLNNKEASKLFIKTMRNAEHLGEFEIVDLVLGKIKFWIYKEKIKNYNEIVVTNSIYEEIAIYYPNYGLKLMKEGCEELLIQLIVTNLDILNEYKTINF